MKRYRYIFWDLDGTIINSYPGIRNCLHYALEPMGITLETEAQIRKFIGPPFRVSLPKYLGFDRETTERVIARYRERYNPIGIYESEVFPGVRETMEQFRRDGYVQMVTSSKPEAQCRAVLERFRLTELLDDIVGATSDGRIDTKIEVLGEAFRRIRERAGEVDRSEVVLLGDTLYDADGARQAGIDCIGLTYGFGTEKELKEHGVIAVFPTLFDMYKVLFTCE